MSLIGSYYDLLGIDRSASAAEVRQAYRQAARANHPDRHGDASAERMAAINEAWQVLGQPACRREYDLTLEAPGIPRTGPAAPAATFSESRYHPLARYQDPPRYPWRLMLWLAAGGVALVVLGVLTAGDPIQPSVDNVLDPGDCVSIDLNGDAFEQLCTEPHDGTVRVLVAFDERCPDGAEPHRDRQGMGTACVLPD